MTLNDFKPEGYFTRRSALLACAGALLSACGGARGGAPAQSSHELAGAIAPAFELKPVGGGAPIGPQQFVGKVVIVDFWATWCEPCRQSFPAYQRLLDKYADKLVVIGVSVDDDDSGIAAFQRETGVKFPLVWDRDQSVSASYKPKKMPTSYIADQNQLIRDVHEGFRAGDDAEIERIVTALF